MVIRSPEITMNGPVPERYTCDGQNIRPEIQIEDPPAETKSLAIIVEDPDAPGGVFTHWVIWNIPASTSFLPEDDLPPGINEGMNSFNEMSYGGPCPPPGKPHRYVFRVYALDSMIDLPDGAGRDELEELIRDHFISSAELIGLYGRGEVGKGSARG